MDKYTNLGQTRAYLTEHQFKSPYTEEARVEPLLTHTWGTRVAQREGWRLLIGKLSCQCRCIGRANEPCLDLRRPHCNFLMHIVAWQRAVESKHMHCSGVLTSATCTVQLMSPCLPWVWAILLDDKLVSKVIAKTLLAHMYVMHCS